ncbi:16S rRNA methyltransferase B [Lactobacillus selangorensis]|uniref:16S rRNA (cytosine(967)-C(5))-methyltransferase n=1 Tax=Lactobacillus selangorensis TaxID=81857 RepID=A0A0R2FM22_9LACO|nr:16S rRNA (cytosine(967)-C(5))-methyltransferase RsmB [Lactobacillus selangorensis]KRN29649.1 16S rRNA methyltransferase B [Lactobacillus selangorensis]KRN33822.1 16S rRNA methyltransferase B [Lactobacillus selangorensis]
MRLSKTNPRLLALDLLDRVEKSGSYSNLELDHVIAHNQLDGRDAALLTNIIYGTIQHRLTLDYAIDQVAKKPKKIQDWVRQLLRLSIYQMVYLDKIPNRAIFYDATEIAKQRGHKGVAGFVTGILRQLERQGVPDGSKITNPVQSLSVRTSVPQWLVEKFIGRFGMDKTTHMLASIDRAPRAAMRVNTVVTDRDQVLSALQPAHESLTTSAISPIGLVADGGHFAGTPEFAAGQYTMQDESSQLVAPSLQIQPGDQVLDACAAPGGKTTHIATYLDPAQGGQVLALDLHAKKLKLIEANADRLHVADRIITKAMDARDVKTVFKDTQFDRILVDAPCSGLGLMRRKPEIKYHQSQADFDHLHDIQLAILTSAAATLKVGGLLTYSTCTLTQEENDDVVADFLNGHPAFEQVPVATPVPLTQAYRQSPSVQLLPDDYGTDGFFIATLKRVAD